MMHKNPFQRISQVNCKFRMGFTCLRNHCQILAGTSAEKDNGQ
ncbi:hypothetical protein GYH30_042494 [Glycine max]|uniref:Uncharacterized protein n=1 Tax=Glycine soja TaxID=3848 RepID=A0A0B2SS89_GLYSO|nr:hypothetical protein GYH30_042494 [Glycine max]KHN47730.1 hypothetical protein glysoja_026419 [Glycine soja]